MAKSVFTGSITNSALSVFLAIFGEGKRLSGFFFLIDLVWWRA